MLRELHISNLAVIEDIHINLVKGLNVFTGPTGAGKSLILGAFDILLGKRINADLLRPGTAEGRVTGLFEINDVNVLAKICRVADLPVQDTQIDDPLILTRKLHASGRSSTTINGHPATAAMLRKIAEVLIDIHSHGSEGPASSAQHDSIYLMNPANQLEVLDAYAKNQDLRNEYLATYTSLSHLKTQYEKIITGKKLQSQKLEFYQFQAEEIDEVNPTIGEFEELDARHRVLSNIARLIQDAGNVYSALYDSEGAVTERLLAIVAIIRNLTELDKELQEILELTHNAASELQDASYSLGRYLGRLDLDNNELAEISDRLNALNRLISKYGDKHIEDVIEYRNQLEKEIQELNSLDLNSKTIHDKITSESLKLTELANKINQNRIQNAQKLRPIIIRELEELAINEVDFRIDVIPTNSYSQTGSTKVEMLVRTNPGQPLKPLRSIASGGELSRIMLAVKSIFAQSEQISVLVFDEIDAKVGGRLGSVIGSKLKTLAQHHQILCITHLPQIAAYADSHLKINKTSADGKTRTSVTILNDENMRLAELAEMMTGTEISKTAIAQAKELREKAAENHTIVNLNAITPTVVTRQKNQSKKLSHKTKK